MAFDPRERLETWVFYEIAKTGDGRPVYRRANYNFVSYDGAPERYLEPVNNDNVAMTENAAGTYAHQMLKPDTHFGRVVGFEFLRGDPVGVHSFGDRPVEI